MPERDFGKESFDYKDTDGSVLRAPIINDIAVDDRVGNPSSSKKMDYRDMMLVSNLGRALSVEEKKYEESLSWTRDMILDSEMAANWGSIVAGYNLVEIGLKLVIRAREDSHKNIHKVERLFSTLCEEDKRVLRLYYDDFLQETDYLKDFPFRGLDDYLSNLDHNRAGSVGSVAWRYFLLEGNDLQMMSTVCVELMFELVRGCLDLLDSIGRGGLSGRFTISWRKHHWEQRNFYNDWLMVRINLPNQEPYKHHIELLWGPDYRDRYSYFVFDEAGTRRFFGRLPEDTKGLPVVDKREDVKLFDREAGLRSIGVVPQRRR